MPGFTLIQGDFKSDSLKYKSKRLLVENLEYSNIKIQRRTIKKFLNDKIFYQDENYLIVTEGIIFNKFELIQKYKQNNFKDTIIEMYKNEKEFFKDFKGSFCGIFIDKKNELIQIFTDHIGEKRLYYYNQENKIILSSNMFELINILNINELNYSLDKLGVYTFLTYGNMREDYTLVKEIKFLKAGQYLQINNKEVKVQRYHKFTLKPIEEKTEEDIINKIDILFNKAIKMQLGKNKEYNLLNLAPLSAGYDSRMTNFVLKKYCKDIINVTYSQSNYYDENIPKKISSDLKNEWFFKSLDNGISYKYFKNVINISYGTIYSVALCHLFDTFEKFDFSKIGVVHTGMFGECLGGNECEIENLPYRSKKVNLKFEKLYKSYKKENFDNFEIENYYNGSFICEHYGSPKYFQEKTESFSPFYDVDFINYTLNIPKNLRKNHYIYNKWILNKYPEAAKYPTNGMKIGCRYINILGKKVTISKIFTKTCYYFLKKLKIIKYSKSSMNPLDYWYYNNLELKRFFDDLFNNNIDNIKLEKDIYKDCSEMYLKGNTLEKDIVLTFLLTYKKLFLIKEGCKK